MLSAAKTIFNKRTASTSNKCSKAIGNIIANILSFESHIMSHVEIRFIQIAIYVSGKLYEFLVQQWHICIRLERSPRKRMVGCSNPSHIGSKS